MIKTAYRSPSGFRLVFWQQAPSPHQAPLFAALAARLGGANVIGVFQGCLGADRLSLGWRNPDYGEASLVMKPEAGEVEEIIRTDKKRSIHVFSHIPDDPAVYAVYKRCVSEGVKTGLMAEGRDWRGWRGTLRRVRSALAESRLRADLDFVLAIGSVGMQWYAKVGFPAAKTYPFCYVVKSNNPSIEVLPATGDAVRIVYVGQLIRRKRIDLLIRALATVTNKNWILTIIGAGDQGDVIEALVRRHRLQDQVEFTGALPNDEVYRRLSGSDLLVLPSLWDGWGAVVNEALHAGVPVVCSNFCGAGDIVVNAHTGELFEAGDVNQLTSCLQKRIAAGRLNAEQRRYLSGWASCLGGEAVADYTLAVLEHAVRDGGVAPIVPWKRGQQSRVAAPEVTCDLGQARL